MVLYDHPLEMDLTARIKEANDQGKPPLDIHVLPRDKHWQKLLHSLIAELKPEMSGPALAVIENLEKASEAGAGADGQRAVCLGFCLRQQR